MKPDKSHALIKEWRQLVADKKAVDYRLARWASVARGEFGTGTAGDEQFFRWLDTELGLMHCARIELLTLAQSFKIAPDQETWATQGAAQIRRLVDLPRRQQVEILEAAKVEGRKIGAVLKSRMAPAPSPSLSSTVDLDKATIARFVRRLDDHQIAEGFADAIADYLITSPAHVLAAAKRYVAISRRRTKKAA